eukprot:gene22237-23322_t
MTKFVRPPQSSLKLKLNRSCAFAALSWGLASDPASAACNVTNATLSECDSTAIFVQSNTGTSSLAVGDISSVGIFYAPPSNTPSGTYTESLTISGTTVLDSTGGQSNVNGGSTINMGATASAQNDGVTLNSSVTIDSGAVLNSHARYGGGVFLRSEGAGNLYISNAGTVTSLGIHDDNTALTNDEVNGGSF